MSAARLNARIPSAEYLVRGQLKGHRLKFHKKSKDGSGKCDAYKTGNPIDVVWGAVFSLPESDLQLLDRCEGKGSGYERIIAPIHTESPDVIEAHSYIATITDASLLPFDWYKEHVLRGAYEIALPKHYIEAIETIETKFDANHTRRNTELEIYKI